MNRSRFVLPLAAIAIGAGVALLPQLSGCTKGSGTHARAFQVTSRDQLVGGPRALGDIGDFVISNGRIRAVIQGQSASRGFGVFGGSLIDLDLERPRTQRDSRPIGGDGLSEIFPAFFLRGLEPDSVAVKNDGSDGKPAVISVVGRGDEFITGASMLNEIMLPEDFRYAVEYELEPVPPDAPPEVGRSLLMRIVASNATKDQTPIQLLTDDFPIAFGLITLFGGGQSLFLPGEAGYDLRHALDAAYANAPALPAMPGVVSRTLVSTGQDVSYALAPVKANLVESLPDRYPGHAPDSLVVPFVASSFLGVFFHRPPAQLDPGKSTSYEVRIFVGNGDVASAMDLVTAFRGEAYGMFTGTVREANSGVPVGGIDVVIKDGLTGKLVTACRSREDGFVHARLAPGRYIAVAVGDARHSLRSNKIEIAEGETTYEELTVGQRSFVSASVVDETGRPIPAKVTLVGRYGYQNAGEQTRNFLFDLTIGEPFLHSDFVPDDPTRPETLEYIEQTLQTGASGLAEEAIRPGKYRVVASRGTDYTIAEQEIELLPGASKHVALQLRRVIDLPEYISGDFHVHTTNSIDSHISLEERALTYAAEGIDYVTLTDHNFVTDMNPTIERAGLSDWMKSSIGLELSTLELGHFNSYPLNYAPGSVTHGSFEWFRIPAGALFSRLRDMSALPRERSVVQVNHPRDTIQGYFNTFGMDEQGRPTLRTDAARPTGPEFELGTWSEDFDAMEVINGKHIEFVHSYRVPEVLPPPPLPRDVPVAGTIVRLEPDPEIPGDPGKVAFPGNFEDWLALLRRGKVITGMANSDSHDKLEGEAGWPRTLVRVGQRPASMRQIDHGAVVDAIREQAVLMSSGAVVELFVNDAPVGSLVSAPDGRVRLKIRVQAPPWVSLDKLLLYTGGSVDPEPLALNGTDPVVRAEHTLERTVTSDTFFVVETSGTKGMWPVVTPIEEPPILLANALNALPFASTLLDDGLGNLRPELVRPATPMAMTNPIWIDVDGDGVSFGKGKKVSALTAPIGPVERLPNRGFDVLKFFRGAHAH